MSTSEKWRLIDFPLRKLQMKHSTLIFFAASRGVGVGVRGRSPTKTYVCILPIL